MIRESSAVAARQNLGDLLNQVQYRNDAVLITKDGKPVASSGRCCVLRADSAIARRIHAPYRRPRQDLRGLTPAVAQAEIDAAVSAARKARAKRTQTRKKAKKQ